MYRGDGAMWSVEAIDIESSAVELDFSSSGQGRRAATAVGGGIRLFNAIELVDVEPSATQVEVCECCGLPHCSPGGWVAFSASAREWSGSRPGTKWRNAMGDISMAPIEFWLGLPGTPSWRGLGHIEAQTCFLIDGGLALVPRGGLTNGGK